MKKIKLTTIVAAMVLTVSPIMTSCVANSNVNVVQAAKKSKTKKVLDYADVYNKKLKIVKHIKKGTKVKNLGTVVIKGAGYTKIGKNQYVDNMYFSKKYAKFLKETKKRDDKSNEIDDYISEHMEKWVPDEINPGIDRTPVNLLVTKKTTLYKETKTNKGTKLKKYKTYKAGSTINFPRSVSGISYTVWATYTKKGNVKKIKHSKWFLRFWDRYGDFAGKKDVNYYVNIDDVELIK